MLTARQRDIYRFIKEFVARHGEGPLLTEIAAGVGMHSKGTVHRYVRELAAQGLVQVSGGRHRGISVPQQTEVHPAGAPILPLVGKIAAGRPIEAIAGEEQINLAEFFMGPHRFVLRVQGDSMIDAGILDGDMVVAEKRDWADTGAIVIALIDNDEATLKRVRHNRDGSVTLIPANRALTPVTYSAERVQIQGIVVGQMRAYR